MATGVDPVTAQPFIDVRRLLDASIERNVVGRNETMIALVNGQPYGRSPTRIHPFDWTSNRR